MLLIFEQGFKTEELCDEHMCPGKLDATKKAEKQEQQNGSGKPSGEDLKVVKEEPQPEPKLLENNTVTPPVPSKMLKG